VPAATNSPASEATPTPTESPTPEPTAGPLPTATPDNSIVVACGDILAPLDKDHRLTPDCAPGDLVTLAPHLVSAAGQAMRADAAAAFGELFNAAQAEGYTILAASAYRSYQTQVVVYGGHVARLGVAAADRISARPGHSEHQLGTTTDVTSESAGFSLGGFEGTPEAAWLAENSWRFGFIVSYPAGKEHITGYSYEPWHIRWIGKDAAAQVRSSGLTLHEWLLR
jgi:D-alanyl-D-alanine carboxypeptidase